MKKTFLLFVLGILLVSFVYAETNYCCEKTTNGAWCQNTIKENCNLGKEAGSNISYRAVPSSCEATSYCSLGTCYNSQEGTCMENTAQRVCNDNGGVWTGKKIEDVPQCQLGCCLMGDQAAFVTQTRCKRISALYGLETDFRTSISSEVQCIASAKSSVEGACVYEKDFEKTCKFTTQEKCSAITSDSGNASEFYEGTLCSDEKLGTNCGPTEKTVCVEGRDEVFFVDSCGNLANIYDASRIEDKLYWADVVSRDSSCNPTSSNANSKTCGNCNYYLGSTCKSDKAISGSATPNYGTNICQDLSCNYKGKTYQHGETWCADVPGITENLPGSRAFRLVCYNGEVSVEACADFRQEVCVQDKLNGFLVAGCVVNRWQDCTSQLKQKDCENSDKRDCKWVAGVSVSTGSSCVPKNAPGFEFWQGNGSADSSCSQAKAECTVTCEKGIIGGTKCTSDLGCVDESGEVTSSWEAGMNKVCNALGDCGIKKNFIGILGYNNESAITKLSADGEKKSKGGLFG